LVDVNGKTKWTFDHDFIFFFGRIQHAVPPLYNPQIFLSFLIPFQGNDIVVKRERERRESTPSKPRLARRTKKEAEMYRSATKIVCQLCQDVGWKDKVVNGTDAEWLELTNQLIATYSLGIVNVRELLLYLGPKQPTLELDSALDSPKK
jgi:hypothetical protein